MGEPARESDTEKKVAVRMATSVIIPARNEEKTIGAIVRTFNEHHETKGNVFVFIDAASTDDTGREVWASEGSAIHTDRRGKGQVVAQGVWYLNRHNLLTNRIILCDGDYTGLTVEHVSRILEPERGMTIGIPDFPSIDIPEHVINAWPHVSGFRCVPWGILPHDAHGYLLETQLNQLAARYKMKKTLRFMNGLKSPFQWPLATQRMAELIRDREWGLSHGVL